jgi:hypothetical protein
LGFLHFESGQNVRVENKNALCSILYLGYSILAMQKCGLGTIS